MVLVDSSIICANRLAKVSAPPNTFNTHRRDSVYSKTFLLLLLSLILFFGGFFCLHSLHGSEEVTYQTKQEIAWRQKEKS